jgi:hypothetical protein
MFFLVLILLGLFLFGLGFYALLMGEINLARASIRGPLVRLFGLFLMVFTFLSIPIVFRILVGLGMNLGR